MTALTTALPLRAAGQTRSTFRIVFVLAISIVLLAIFASLFIANVTLHLQRERLTLHEDKQAAIETLADLKQALAEQQSLVLLREQAAELGLVPLERMHFYEIEAGGLSLKESF